MLFEMKANITLVDHRVREPSESDLTKSVRIWTSLLGRSGNYIGSKMGPQLTIARRRFL